MRRPSSVIWFSASLHWNHYDTSIPYATLSNDMIGEMSYLCALSHESRDFHAALIAQMHVQRSKGKIMMTMKVLNQSLRQVASRVVVHIDESCNAFPFNPSILLRLLNA